MPDGKWAFDAEVTAVFDEMLPRSIPSYHEMRWLTHAVASKFMKDDWSTVIDIGASRGDSVDWFINHRPHHKYKLLEISEPMRQVLDERYRELTNVKVHDVDLRDCANFFKPLHGRVSVVLSVLTLMFVPVEHRHTLLQHLYDSLEEGGALILVEKLVGSTPMMNQMLNQCYYEMKAKNGYTKDQIQRKKLSLEGVLVPLTEDWNINLLNRCGFKEVECFFRSLQFAGFVCVK